ncbi:hypothetical protein R6Q59_024893 [Mikania micrantha]
MGCESSKPKKRRSRGRNLKLYKKFAENGKKSLPIQVDEVEGMFGFVGPNQSDFEYFDLDSFRGTSNWGGIQAAITNECKNAYARKKSKLKKHFIKHGGYDNVEAATNCPPPDYDVYNYHRAIDELFTTAESKKRSEKNKINRSKHRYPSYHGSESYKQKRWKEKKMKNVAAEMAANDFTDSDVDELLVIKQVLGNKRGHIPGVGRVVRNEDPTLSSYADHPITHWQQQLHQQELQQQHQQDLQEQLQQQQRRHEEEMRNMKEEIKKQMEEIRREFSRRD